MNDFETAFGRPFDNKGKPSKYLAFLVPLMEKEYTTKQEMLKMVGIDLASNPAKRGSHATTLATYTRLKILETRPRGDGTWRKGERWCEFMWWLIQKNTLIKKELKNSMFQLDNLSLDYIFKD